MEKLGRRFKIFVTRESVKSFIHIGYIKDFTDSLSSILEFLPRHVLWQMNSSSVD